MPFRECFDCQESFGCLATGGCQQAQLLCIVGHSDSVLLVKMKNRLTLPLAASIKYTLKGIF